jgi:hypothetical protein
MVNLSDKFALIAVRNQKLTLDAILNPKLSISRLIFHAKN